MSARISPIGVSGQVSGRGLRAGWHPWQVRRVYCCLCGQYGPRPSSQAARGIIKRARQGAPVVDLTGVCTHHLRIAALKGPKLEGPKDVMIQGRNTQA